ncbi:MAG: patatin-like phospholipase family protein [Cypionkella sp.]
MEKRRILSIDGGGLRGIVAVAFLERFEQLCSERAGRSVRLHEIFDLVGGTSTGAIIATTIALGKTMPEIRKDYVDRGKTVFVSSWDPRRRAMLRPRFDARLLEAELERDLGTRTFDSPDLLTRLAIVAKRLDTGSPWILSNISTSPYFDDPKDGSFLGNRHYRLSKVLLASTAAPSLFQPLTLQVAPDQREALFVDGAITPWNDPSVPLLMLARMKAFGLEWPTGPERLKLLSVGTGFFRDRITPERAFREPALAFAVQSLMTLIGDSATQTQMLMRWLGRPLHNRAVNSEIGDLADETFGPEPLFSYLRLDVPLEMDALAAMGHPVVEKEMLELRRIDQPKTMSKLHEIASAVVELQLTAEVVEAFMG